MRNKNRKVEKLITHVREAKIFHIEQKEEKRRREITKLVQKHYHKLQTPI